MNSVDPQPAPDKQNSRTRLSGHHRGWSPSVRTPERVAKDIAESILLHRIHGDNSWTPAMYTTDAATLVLAKMFLADQDC